MQLAITLKIFFFLSLPRVLELVRESVRLLKNVC